MAGENNALKLLSISDEIIQDLRAERTARYEVMGNERHHHGSFSSALIERIKRRLPATQHEIWRVGVPSGVTRGWIRKTCDVHPERRVTVRCKGNLEHLPAMAFNERRQIIVPHAAIPFDIGVLQQQIDRVVARKAGTPAANMLAQQVFEN